MTKWYWNFGEEYEEFIRTQEGHPLISIMNAHVKVLNSLNDNLDSALSQICQINKSVAKLNGNMHDY